MATTGIACDNCGRQLQASDKFCPACGTKRTTAHGVQAGPHPARVCEVCGHTNSHTGVYCESCGVELSVQAGHALPGKAESGKQKPNDSLAIRPWHYVVGVLIVGIVGTFIYLEAGRQTGADASTGVPLQAPASQQAPAPPSKELLQAIEHFEHVVRDNPNDAGAKLKLANSLHDASIGDPKFLTRAIDAYKHYLQQMPGDPNARVDLGICYFELGKRDTARAASLYAIAINEMETALKRSPNHQAGAYNLGIVNLYAGNLQASNTWLKKAAELNPDSELGRRAKSIVEQHLQAE